MLVLKDLLTEQMKNKASDMHLIVGMPPLLRIHTQLKPIEGRGELTQGEAMSFLREMVGEARIEKFEQDRDLDFSTALEGVGRFRVNAHWQRDSIGMAFRSITDDIPPLENLNLPQAVQSLVNLPRGLVLVTGVTGSGKSTTLASMINAVNMTRASHIITLEDPVEYVLHSQKSVIEQRELGSDVPTFASGLRHALRQDPDIILVGEMRDLETTSAAISAAETGHLVLATLHTQNAAQTIERIIDIYPAQQQNQIRAMLSNTLQAVVSQVLFPRVDTPGMVPACEIMICTPAIRNCIRENRIHEIQNIIETSKAAGMCTLDDSIKTQVINGRISKADAVAHAARPEALAKALGS